MSYDCKPHMNTSTDIPIPATKIMRTASLLNIIPKTGLRAEATDSYTTGAYSGIADAASAGQTAAESGLTHSNGKVRHLSGLTGLMRQRLSVVR